MFDKNMRFVYQGKIMVGHKDVISKLDNLVEEVYFVNRKNARILVLIIQIIKVILSDDYSDSDSGK